jgi:hypothetical protein
MGAARTDRPLNVTLVAGRQPAKAASAASSLS